MLAPIVKNRFKIYVLNFLFLNDSPCFILTSFFLNLIENCEIRKKTVKRLMKPTIAMGIEPIPAESVNLKSFY